MLRKYPLLSFVILTVLAFASFQNPATAQAMFADDFESYPLGTTFPCCYPANPDLGEWEVLYSGRSEADQLVVTDPGDPGNQVLQLWGRYMWSAVLQRRFDSASPVLAWSFRIRISARGDYYAEQPAFLRYRGEYPPYDYWGTGYGFISFFHNPILPETPAGHGEIWSESHTTLLGTWQPGRWYDVTVVLDRDPQSPGYRTYSVWIDGRLTGEEMPLSPVCRPDAGGFVCDGEKHPEKIDAVQLISGHDGVQVYYDDVAVFVPDAGFWILSAESAVADFFEQGFLNQRKANALQRKLKRALRNLDDGDLLLAKRHLRAFVRQVANLVARDVLTRVQGDSLSRPARYALDELSV